MTHDRSATTPRSVEGLVDEEWQVARIARVNILLVGSERSAERIVDALRPDFCHPIEVWRPASRLVLPPVAGRGTLILQDVGGMPHDDQRRLCAWLDATDGRTRVVSTNRQPLFPLVEAGTFVERLYYRLNAVCLVITECDKLTVLRVTR